jgi:hypothetical protein
LAARNVKVRLRSVDTASLISLAIPQTSGRSGVPTVTPQRNVWPIWLSSSCAVARKAGQPSSAVNGCIVANDHCGDAKPCAFQLPVSRALTRNGRRSPVRYSKFTGINAIGFPSRLCSR